MTTFTLGDAVKEHLSGNHAKARQMYTSIISMHPNKSAPLFHLASLNVQEGRLAEAMIFLEAAVYRDPEDPSILNNLGTMYRRLNHADLALEAYKKALENPGEQEADLRNNIGTVYINEGTPMDGIHHLRRAIELDPDLVQAHWNLGLLLLEMRQWEEGWKEYHYGVVADERMNRWATWPQWHREPGKVLIYGEQGLGDEIMFSSILPDAIQDADITLECHPRLEDVFKRSFDVQVFPTRKQPHSDEIAKLPEFKYRSAIGDLGMLYRNTEESFPRKPYLKLDKDKLAEVKKGYEKYPRPWIGVGWRGGKQKTRRELRSLFLEQFKPIMQGPGTYFSFQYEPNADQEVDKFCRENPDINLLHFPSIARCDNYDVVLHHLYAMDCVVHVNGSAVHACGAIGQPCYVLTPSRCAWRYSLSGEDMPFYGQNTRQIRQVDDDWTSAVNKVSELIKDKVYPDRLEA